MAQLKPPVVNDTVKYNCGHKGVGTVTALSTGNGGLVTVTETSPGSITLKLDRLLLFINAA